MCDHIHSFRDRVLGTTFPNPTTNAVPFLDSYDRVSMASCRQKMLTDTGRVGNIGEFKKKDIAHHHEIVCDTQHGLRDQEPNLHNDRLAFPIRLPLEMNEGANK